MIECIKFYQVDTNTLCTTNHRRLLKQPTSIDTHDRYSSYAVWRLLLTHLAFLLAVGSELAVNVPVTDDEADQVTYEDDAERAQAMVNSPNHKDNALAFQGDEDGGGMSLNLGDEDDEEEDVNKVTPNTKQRDQMGINSPRNKQKQDWDSGLPFTDKMRICVQCGAYILYQARRG